MFRGRCVAAMRSASAVDERLFFKLNVGFSSDLPAPRDKAPAPPPDGARSGLRPAQNDPYRIKVPEVTVPPMPPTNAKPMVMCPCRRGMPCAPRGKLCVPPAPPPPPPEPFPWHYFYPAAFIFGMSGLLYKMYMVQMETNQSNSSDPTWKPRPPTRRPFYSEEIPEKVQYLIIGAGTAGMAAYSAIKEFDSCAKVFFVSEEDILPYERTALNKGMWFNEKAPDVRTLIWTNGTKKSSMFYLKPDEYTEVADFSRRQRGPAVSVACGWRATRVDADRLTCYLDTPQGERPIGYEKCLIATGANACNLDVFKYAPREVRRNVTRMRTIRDLETAYDKMQSAERCVVIGNGPLASELSWTLGHLYNKTDRGEDAKPVEIVQIMREKGVLTKFLPDYLAEWAAEMIKDEGVTVVPKSEVYDAYVNPESGRLTLYLSSGKELETDYVFVCVGTEPNVSLAKASMLETDPKLGGFLVNTEMLARSHLYVAGDAASLYQQEANSRQQLAHLLDAATSGCVAGENMTGRWTAYNQPSQFHVRFGDKVHMEAVGEVDHCMTTVGVFAKCTMECDKAKVNGNEVEHVKRKSKAKKKMPKTNCRANANNADKSVLSPQTDQSDKDADGRMGDGDNKDKVAAPSSDTQVILSEPKEDKPCYKKTEEYKKRYEKGIVYYMRDDIIAGIVMWNIDEDLVPDRVGVLSEIIRAQPTYNDIETINDLLHFKDDKC